MNEKLLVPDIGEFENVEVIEILVKPGLILICSNSLLIVFYNTKVKINKIIKIIIKKYITDF